MVATVERFTIGVYHSEDFAIKFEVGQEFEHDGRLWVIESKQPPAEPHSSEMWVLRSVDK